MNRKSSLPIAAAFLFAACGNNADTASTKTDSPGVATANATAPITAQPASDAVNTSDPATATLENENVRIKLHGLTEVSPDPTAPGKPEAGKKYYNADISLEYLKASTSSPSEYLLSAYLLDDKGVKHSLPMESVKVAAIASSAQASLHDAQGTSFGKSNLASGEKFRGQQYGAVMDAGAKPVKFGATLDGKAVEASLN